jgi:hypothetical protein
MSSAETQLTSSKLEVPKGVTLLVRRPVHVHAVGAEGAEKAAPAEEAASVVVHTATKVADAAEGGGKAPAAAAVGTMARSERTRAHTSLR